ncbi:MAG TPA: polyprenyl synthetase family protein [Actinobacteria bacterium]|nr:polyprenyl synthetase family protein [Actinomycetota bacterium]
MSPVYPEDLKKLVNSGLEKYFPEADQRLSVVTDAMAYTLFSSGKRFRPVLALLAAEAVGADPEVALPLACAIEFIHTYSLIHDDLPAIDNDTLRRGRPTCHVKYGEDVAIMAGDALFAEAFVLILTEQSKLIDSERLVRMLRELAIATGINGMVGGQVVDIVSTGQTVGHSTLEYIHNHKTGSLIVASAACGAILGGADEAQLKAITGYAGHLGLSFQIIDDILDIEGSAKTMGKNVGSDIGNQKITYPGTLGVNKSKEVAEATAKKAVSALTGANMHTDRLMEMSDFVLGRTS